MRKFKPPKGKKAKFIPCNEFSQIYNWQKTNKGEKSKKTK